MSRLHSIWDFIRHHKYAVVILFFLLLLGVVDENSWWHGYQRRQEIKALKAEKQTYIDQYNRDTEELNDLLNNPDAAERVARERYLMKRADEDVYVILTPQDQKTDTLTAQTDAPAQ